MRLYNNVEHPLRVYLEEEYSGEISKLIYSLDSKYSPPENSYNSEDEVESIIFYDEYSEKYYVVHGLLHIIIKEASIIGIECKNEVDIGEEEVVYPDIDENILEGISLREYQIEGISTALAHKKGIIQVHTGGGKTEKSRGIWPSAHGPLQRRCGL